MGSPADLPIGHQGGEAVGQGHHRTLDLLGGALLGAEVRRRQQEGGAVEQRAHRGHPRLGGRGLGEVAQGGEGGMGLVEVEQPAGRGSPQLGIVEGAQELEVGEQVDRGGRGAGERASAR